jgi:hypothetical protein
MFYQTIGRRVHEEVEHQIPAIIWKADAIDWAIVG